MYSRYARIVINDIQFTFALSMALIKKMLIHRQIRILLERKTINDEVIEQSIDSFDRFNENMNFRLNATQIMSRSVNILVNSRVN